MLFAEPSPIVHVLQLDEVQRLKSIRNKLDYERRKGATMVEQLAAAKDKLLVANDHISDLQHANKSLSNETAALKKETDKSASLLSSRTERFVEFRVRKEDELKRVKARAEKKVQWLEKQHGLAISKIQAEMYRRDRHHTKEVIRYQNTIESLVRENE